MTEKRFVTRQTNIGHLTKKYKKKVWSRDKKDSLRNKSNADQSKGEFFLQSLGRMDTTMCQFSHLLQELCFHSVHRKKI